MSALQNRRLLDALLRKPVDKTPVWLMRQAGRYLPEYRELRAQAGSFLGLATNPELACEVTLQPLRRFDLDAAIIFSDILTIPDAMGLGLYFSDGEGPRFERPVRSAADVKRLATPDPNDNLRYVMDALSRTRAELAGRVPLIGFAGSPWTVATYAVEGGTSKNYAHIKALAFGEPKTLHALLDKIAVATADYLNAQIDAGAQAVMIFDTWGSILAGPAYREFSLHYMRQIADALRLDRDERVPLVMFTKGGGQWLEDIAHSGADALGLDWTVSLGAARQQVGDRVALQGNLDPGVLYGNTETVKAQVADVLADYGHGHGHVFNLGHGIHPTIDPANVATLVDAVHELSIPYHL